MRNVLFWIGVTPTDQRVTQRFRYGDFEWMQYSRYTWEHWCHRHGVEFVHYHTPLRDDLMTYKVNWQRWLDVFDYIGDYDGFLSVDASTMVRWDAPNYFDITPDGYVGAMLGDENWKWAYESVNGYKFLFPDVDFDYSSYVCSGIMLFRKQHENFLREYGKYYLEHHDTLLELEDVKVKRSRDQTVMNYFLKKHNIPVHPWPIDMAVSHLYRREILNGNWQYGTDRTPFFIKYFNLWAFSGFSDRGDTRTELMSKTWEFIKHKYDC